MSLLCIGMKCIHCYMQDRGYVVRSAGRSLVPTPLGRLLSAYLAIHFPEYVDVNFTARVEEQLDEVSGGYVTLFMLFPSHLAWHLAFDCCIRVWYACMMS